MNDPLISFTGAELLERTASAFTTISEAAAQLDRLKSEFILIRGENGQPVGFVRDIEIRMALLRDLSPSESAAHIANKEFSICGADAPPPTGMSVVLDSNNTIAEARVSYMNESALPATAVVMAGGLGSRMGPMTGAVPKPLIPVAGRAMIEHVLLYLARNNIQQVAIAVNYLGAKIEAHVGCGARYGISARYIHEDKRLGTAGALSLLDPVPQGPVCVINADVITKLNLRAMARHHYESGAAMTVAVVSHITECPFGVARLSDFSIIDMIEKPRSRNWINAGVYIISPAVFRDVPRNTYIDMTTMIQKLIAGGETVTAFPIREYWHDAGTPQDIERVSADLTNQPGADPTPKK
ncbi:MAG: NTP transferase domain-containing protein [Planctomycetes bacterium]|nr:NTP transferase domain-containing protein [Planctomycetota bacterium]